MSDEEYYSSEDSFSNEVEDIDINDELIIMREPNRIEKKCLSCKENMDWNSKYNFCYKYACKKMYKKLILVSP